ncbi:MAG: tripartite tricarboxylate transporter substrate binding protein [Burkholderiaceae bacterium]
MKHLATPLAFEAHAGPGSSPHGAPRAPARRRAVEAAAAVLLAAAGRARAQAFPARPLRLVVPFPPGGPTDIVARPLAQLLADALRQQVVVDNRGGAGGSIGADAVAKAPSDGYTLLMGTVGTHAINASLYRRLPYDPVKDFTALGLVASAPVAVVVPAASPFASVADLVAAARREPDAIAFGSAGNGTPGHLTGELFAKAAGVNLRHVPYKGSAPAVTDLVGGQIPLMFDPVQSVLGNISAGKLRALAVSGRARSPVLPQVPTLAEAGLKDFEATAWWAVFAPANLPPPVAAQLGAEIERVVASAAFRERLGNLGVLPAALARDAFAEFQRAELAKWGRAVRDSGATLD